MGSKPKKEKPSAAERTNASVATAEYQYFKENYDPLLQQMRDKSLTQDTASTLRGRANADTMQALTSDISEKRTQNVQDAGNLATGYTGQLQAANAASKQIDNKAQTNVLGIARKQAADAQSGMASAARMAATESLEKAKAKQQVNSAKWSAVGTLAGAAGTKALANKASYDGETLAKGEKASYLKSYSNRNDSFLDMYNPFS